MATLPQPIFTVRVNGVFLTSTQLQAIISIKIDEYFDTDFTVSRLEILFNARYIKSPQWKYKDQIIVQLWRNVAPANILTTGTFYIDFAEDIKSSGEQLYRISALEADPNLGFTYGVDTIVNNNKTIRQSAIDFASLFGLTLTQNITANVTSGTIKDIFGTPNINLATIEFTSYADMLRYISNNFGYFGNLSGLNLQFTKINSFIGGETSIPLYNIDFVLDFQTKQSYTEMYSEYRCRFYDRPSNVLSVYLVQPNFAAQLNQKQKQLEYDEAYYNITAAQERCEGELLLDFIKAFEIRLTVYGFFNIRAGRLLFLNSSYGQHEGYYRILRAFHTVDQSGWKIEITAFPIQVLDITTTIFRVGYTGTL